MAELAKKIFENYGFLSIIGVLILIVVIWLNVHLNAASGGKVSILWGLVEYDKKQSKQLEPSIEINKGSKYGFLSIIGVLILIVVIWLNVHLNAASGGKVSILWGLVEYDKKQSKQLEPSIEINKGSKSTSEIDKSKAVKTRPENDPLFPKLVGPNVEFPASILENTTPGYKTRDKFYIAIHENRWNPQEGDKEYEMVRTGDKLTAKNVINKRFHPVIVPQVWQKIEQAYDRYMPPKGEMANNIDNTNPNGPCYCFGTDCVSYKDGGR